MHRSSTSTLLKHFLWTNTRCGCGLSHHHNYYSTMSRQWVAAATATATAIVTMMVVVQKMVIFVSLSCKVHSTTPLVQIKNRSKHILKIYGCFLFEFKRNFTTFTLENLYAHLTLSTPFIVQLFWIEFIQTNTSTHFAKWCCQMSLQL